MKLQSEEGNHQSSGILEISEEDKTKIRVIDNLFGNKGDSEKLGK